jgi:hypothetical protein
MNKLNKYNFHDSRISEYKIKKVNKYYSILMDIYLFNGQRLVIEFNNIELYNINCSNKEQYDIEIDNYKYVKNKLAKGTHIFYLQSKGIIEIKTNKLNIKQK